MNINDISDGIESVKSAKNIFSNPKKISINDLKNLGVEVVDINDLNSDKEKLKKAGLKDIRGLASEKIVGYLSNKFNTSQENVKKVLMISGILLLSVGTLSIIGSMTTGINFKNGIKRKDNDKVNENGSIVLNLSESEYNAIMEARLIMVMN